MRLMASNKQVWGKLSIITDCSTKPSRQVGVRTTFSIEGACSLWMHVPQGTIAGRKPDSGTWPVYLMTSAHGVLS